MSEYDKFYKHLSKAADFIVLVADRTILIINNKLASHTMELADFINLSNAIGLKKKHLIWNELIKNYTSLATSLINMTGFDHTINYSRKSLIKELLGKKEADYIKRKIDSLTNAGIKFIENVEVFNNSLEYLAKNLDIIAPSKEIKNLNDVYKLVEQTLETIKKKHFPKVQQINREILEKHTKEGSFESCPCLDNLHLSLQKFAIQGGFESDTNHYQIVIGGAKEEANKVMIGGFHIESYLKQQFINLQLVKDEIVKLTLENVNELYLMLSQKLEPYLDLSKLNHDALFRQILFNSGSLNNITEQFANLVENIIPKLLNYHINRFNIVNRLQITFAESSNLQILDEIIYEDEYGVVNCKIDWQPLSNLNIKIPLQSAIVGIQDTFKLIDRADIQKIIKVSKDAFKEISKINNVEDFEKEIKTLKDDYLIIIDKDFSFESRKNAKEAIKQKINNIQNLLESPISEKINLPTIILPNFSKSQNLNLQTNDPKIQLSNLETLSNLAETILNLESKLVPQLKAFEIYYDKLVLEIYNLIVEIETLISPDNKFTCIKRPTLIIVTGLKVVMLNQLSQKRFVNTESFEKNKLEEIINNIKNILENDLDFYNSQDGLNIQKIEEAAKLNVGVF